MSNRTHSIESLSKEILHAFGSDPPPKPGLDYGTLGDQQDRLMQIKGRPWMNLAGDLNFMVLHSFDELLLLPEDFFLYYFPAYLVAVLLHKKIFIEMVLDSLARILNPTEKDKFAIHMFSILVARLSIRQKKAVANWIEFQLELDMANNPELYSNSTGSTEWEAALVFWRKCSLKVSST